MSDTSEIEPGEDALVNAEVKKSGRFSLVWLVPIAATLFGLWMLVSYINNRGELIEITFATADGLEAGKTKIKALNVEVGLVEKIVINEDIDGVIVSARINAESRDLLHEDTRFWVVRPRVGAAGISGLGTLLSGAYIELEPGESEAFEDNFAGLEDAPVTPSDEPGLHITLAGSGRKSLSAGEPVIYNGYQVGKVEQVTFDPKDRKTMYKVFIRKPFDELITTTTHFWATSGVEFTTSTEGIKLDIASFEALLQGGLTFDIPPDLPMGTQATSDTPFRLYSNKAEAFLREYDNTATFVIMVEQSIRGLKPGAPVEFRGVPLGRVLPRTTDFANLQSVEGFNETSIPIFIGLDPARIGFPDEPASLAIFRSELQKFVRGGMVAKLGSGSLVTGNKYVQLDIDPSRRGQAYKEITIEPYGRIGIIPSRRGGFEAIEEQISTLIASLQAAPIDKTLNNASAALASIDKLSQRLDGLVAQESTQQIPANLNTTLSQLQVTLGQTEQTLRGFDPNSDAYRELTRSLGELRETVQGLQPTLQKVRSRPNALIFGGSPDEDPEPKAKASER